MTKSSKRSGISASDRANKMELALNKVLELATCDLSGIGGWTHCIEYLRHGHSALHRPCKGCTIRNAAMEAFA